MTAIPFIDSDLHRHAEAVMELLSRRRLSIVTAESCTAGLVGAVLSEAEGASLWLHGGFVTYTKAQKTAALGVPEQLLSARGSVNGEVARWMAEGALTRSRATMAVAVTGVLGPEEDEDGNPVGLVYLACSVQGQSTRVEERRFPGEDADRLRKAVVSTVLDMVEQAATEKG